MIMHRIVTVMPGNQHEPAKLRMNKLSVAPFAAVNTNESGSLQICNQLANLSRHGCTYWQKSAALTSAAIFTVKLFDPKFPFP